ncbi:MAG: hypothetical protein EHM65_01870, partial [Acidobacteriales bacterium]
ELLARLQSIPGVRSASIGGTTPIHGAGASRFVTAEGRQERPEDRRYVALNWVAPKYFETLGTPLLAGRDFQFEDQNRPRVAIVNQAMARYYFGRGNPIGKRVTLDGDDKPYEIVGVVGDAKYLELRESPPRTMYFNMFQEGRLFSQFVLRTSVTPASVAGEARGVAARGDRPLRTACLHGGPAHPGDRCAHGPGCHAGRHVPDGGHGGARDDLLGPVDRSAHGVLGQALRRESDPGTAGGECIPDCLWRRDDDCARSTCGVRAGTTGSPRGPDGNFAMRIDVWHTARLSYGGASPASRGCPHAKSPGRRSNSSAARAPRSTKTQAASPSLCIG